MTRRKPPDQWIARTPRPIAVRFRAKVDPSVDGCWEWQGWRNRNGYGVMATGPKGGQRKELAHRISWRVNVGPIPDGLRVLHRCDNPPCVRPSHLFLGTQLDNMRDASAKGRVRHHGKLPPETVRAIRAASGPIRAIAADHGVAYSMVSRIRRGEAWRSVA